MRYAAVLFLACLLLAGGVPSQAIQDRAVVLPIVMYHQIDPDPAAANAWTVTPEILSGDLAYLREKGYESVTPEMLAAYARGEGGLPEKPIMITFDDGYESFEAYGCDLFEEFGMTAVISVVGSYADTYTRYEDHDLSYSYFSWPALARLNLSPAVALGSHTYNLHGSQERKGCAINPGESLEAYTAVFSADCQALEERFAAHLGQTPVLFAYPSGIVCGEARQILRQRGYQVLLTTEQKVNYLTGNPEELLDLGRFNRGPDLDREAFFQLLCR